MFAIALYDQTWLTPVTSRKLLRAFTPNTSLAPLRSTQMASQRPKLSSTPTSVVIEVILWPRFHGGSSLFERLISSRSSPSQPSLRRVWIPVLSRIFLAMLQMESALVDDASSWRLWVHLYLAFLLPQHLLLHRHPHEHPPVVPQHLLLHLHLASLAHLHHLSITGAQSWTCSFSIFVRMKIQITFARQVKPFRALLKVPVFVPKNCLGASLGHSRNTHRLGSVTLADLKSIMTLTPFSVLKRTRFTLSVTTFVPSAVRNTTRLAGRTGAPGK